MNKDDDMGLLFTYGTLRQGADTAMRRVISREASYIGEATYRGKLYFAGGHPAAIPSQNEDDQVTGDLYNLAGAPGLLQRLDRYEGYDRHKPEASLYIREEVSVILKKGGKALQAWMYLYNRSVDQAHEIASGDYLAYRSNRKG